jgi:hypothetical protein
MNANNINNPNDDSIVSDFNSGNEEELIEEEENEENSEINLENQIYSPAIYNFDYVYNYFTSKNILKREFKCPMCNEKMTLINNNSFLDKK